jgi:OOP family OmpA-OmpF porin
MVAEGVGARDPDQVAAMLEAIDAFVREAFRPEPSNVHLSNVQVGDLTVWVDRDASLAIAAVVRGAAPPEFGTALYRTRERVYLEYQRELERFESDVGEFADASRILERCLCAQRRTPPRRALVWLSAAALVLAAVLGALWARGHARAAEQTRRLDASVAALAAEPGIAVTSAVRRDGELRIAGFRDPLARPPRELLARRGLAPAELDFEPFYSLDPPIVARRATEVLRPPPGVTLAMDGTALRAAGTAPGSFIERARLLAATLPGVERYDDASLRDEEVMAALHEAAGALEVTAVPFALNSAVVRARGAMQQARSHVRELTGAAREAQLEVCIAITGYTDASGSEATNRRLSALRAQHVAAALEAQANVPPLRARGAGVHPRPTPPARARTAEFEVGVGASCKEAP